MYSLTQGDVVGLLFFTNTNNLYFFHQQELNNALFFLKDFLLAFLFSNFMLGEVRRAQIQSEMVDFYRLAMLKFTLIGLYWRAFHPTYSSFSPMIKTTNALKTILHTN